MSEGTSSSYEKSPQKNLKHDSDYDDNSIREYSGFDSNADQNIQSLARQFTNNSLNSDLNSNNKNKSNSKSFLNIIKTLSRVSTVPGPAQNTFHNDIDPKLDPNSDEFSSKAWIKNLRKLIDTDPDHYKHFSLGLAWKDLRSYGVAADADYLKTVSNFPIKLASNFVNLFKKTDESKYFDILKPMDGLVKPGEVVVVLGRPGSGCSTFLKTIGVQTHGFHVSNDSLICYDGLTPHQISKNYRGEIVYNAEQEVHFPQLTVYDVLSFAAKFRTPENRAPGVDRETYANHLTEVYMATYGLSHTRNTKVGNELIRGVSGGERKRVSIAEVSLCGAPLQLWDNATRGLDAATALEFIRALRTSADVLDSTSFIAIYQCSQDAYDLFDKVILLYEGRQIYFGSTEDAKEFFFTMGYNCPPRQTTADYLTSLTNPSQRIPRKGYENKVPRTAEEFESYWRNSPQYSQLRTDVDEYVNHCITDNVVEEIRESHVAAQSKNQRASSPYRVSYGQQIRYLIQRDFKRIKNDLSITLVSVLGNTGMSFILGSMFYNLDQTTSSFFQRGAALFFAVLFNSFSSLLEIMSLYEARLVTEKHKMYALYHPSAASFSSILTEIPSKIITAIAFNLVYYFMVNFRRSAGHFFFYLLNVITATFAMSHVFRCVGSATKSLTEAMTPASVILLAMTIFVGFTIPTRDMLGWSRWINYINPIAYTFESLMANEFHDREFPCDTFIPSGSGYSADDIDPSNRVCSTVGSVIGQSYVNGDNFINTSFEYYNDHKWRNWGIVLAFAVFFLFIYLVLCEYNEGAKQKGEILLFQRSTLKKVRKQKIDIESGNEKIQVGQNESDSSDMAKKMISGKDIFHWRDVCYDIQIKDETRRILSHVDGWVKPGTLTALMGASGAGKTTLLDVLANRVTMGVVTGNMFVNGHLRDSSFQRSTGYVQQQDLHLRTSTVREALLFSAFLRQPASVSKEEKIEYVDNVIKILEMEKYADAVVGVAGEGLNVEQRKRLTIGVELAAKPQLLLFLDEPTSGLDSETAWSICQLMRKLANNGQAILCTIHQPSAILLKEFDRLLFLAKGGRTVYFGNLGENCQSLINYFEKHGAPKCPKNANPAEWMLAVIGAAPGSKANQDYYEVWMSSSERQEVQKELTQMENELIKLPVDDSPEHHKSFATSLPFQYLLVTRRVFEQYWRSPSYIYPKIFLTVFSALFIGFSFFKAGTSQQGLQNQMFAVFMSLVIFNSLVEQMMPGFVFQRELYEVRERPSKTFSWLAFILAQITVEIPWQVICGTLAYFCFYYPIGLYENAIPTDDVNARGATMWLFFVSFYVYCSTLGQVCIAGIQMAEAAANVGSLLFTMSLTFCGVLAGPDALPRFWIFMYRVSPFTYFIDGVLSVGLSGNEVVCSSIEYLNFSPPSGQTCGEFMSDYISTDGGYLLDENATGQCDFCSIASTDVFLASINCDFSRRWRNFGIFISYIFINFILTIFLYWLARVPKKNDRVQNQTVENQTIENQTDKKQ
ncbi:pleiotropic drug resistance family ABC transporter [Ascoidea rubescens DSM 1968]|uniref:ATP binding cassette transporter Abc1p n=1 Tax=Ascoidea rubescens DSM 1968 TaxID=1344418 RepID=A0A1D2VD80_9ASCO|nr:ATP binding cassette transporter Abc1p [Ascoidea rubescens DSM 1968]ODV59654.1 ATP binding cassette transporter Abc1p [Ascoidea rubescens DSM 1968]